MLDYTPRSASATTIRWGRQVNLLDRGHSPHCGSSVGRGSLVHLTRQAGPHTTPYQSPAPPPPPERGPADACAPRGDNGLRRVEDLADARRHVAHLRGREIPIGPDYPPTDRGPEGRATVGR